ncbi:hypothetical protein ECPA39_3698, partial [Escherichia coli PA39]
MGYAPR